MTSLNNPKTIWQLPNITDSSVEFSRNDILLLAHEIPPSGSGFYYYITFDNLVLNLKATHSLYGTVRIHSDLNSGSSIVYNKLQVDDKLATKENNISNLAISKGGTGITSYNQYDILYATDDNMLGKLPTQFNSVLVTGENGEISWETRDNILDEVRISPATIMEYGTVRTYSTSEEPIVYLTSDVDALLPSETNPIPVNSGGTGITDLTGESGKILTVNSSENGYNLSNIESSDGTVNIIQDSNTGNIDIKLPQSLSTSDEVTFQHINIRDTGVTPSPANHSVLDVQSNTAGVMLPRIPTATYQSWASPQKGLMLFDSTLNKYYYYNGSAWSEMGSSGATIEELNDIGDVVLINSSNDDFLGFDGSNWTNINIDNKITANFIPNIPNITITNATGVFNGTGTTGQIAMRDSNGKITFIDNPSGSLSSLTDTNFTSLSSTSYLRYNGVDKWVNRNFDNDFDTRFNSQLSTISLTELTGVFDSFGTTDQIVAKSSTGKLKFINPSGYISTLAALEDTDITSPNSNSYLRYDGVNSWDDRDFNVDVDARILAYAPNFSINNLTGLFSGTGTTNQIPALNAQGKLTFVDPSGVGLLELSDLQDVNLTGVATNNYLKKSATDWIPGNFATDVDARIDSVLPTKSIANLSGVFSEVGTLGQVPVIDSQGKLEFIDAPGLQTIDLNDLGDTSITSPSNNDILTFVTDSWDNIPFNTLWDNRWTSVKTTITYNELTSIFTNTGTSGQILAHDGTGGIEFIDSPSGSFQGLLDTTFTNLSIDDSVKYNGSEWVNFDFNETVDGRVDDLISTYGISNLTGVFASTGTINQIPALNSGGKLTFIDPPPGTSSSNPVTFSAGGTGITNYTGFAGHFLTVNSTVNAFNLSQITSNDSSVTITQDTNTGDIDLSIPLPKVQFVSNSGNFSLLESYNNKIVKLTNTSTITLPGTLSVGFQCTLLNETGNTMILITSGTLKAKSATFSDQWGAVYCTHEGSNVWIVVGDLDL